MEQHILNCWETIPKFQLSALIPLLESPSGNQSSPFLEKLLERCSLLKDLFLKSLIETKGPACMRVLYKLRNQQPLGESLIEHWVKEMSSALPPKEAIAFALMLIKSKGLQDCDLALLTKALSNSGDIFDYRKKIQFENVKWVRRYPTGAVSEKIALILPSMIGAASKTFPVLSSFLVAKSLSFTGGTWDKLAAIRGFTFPQPGKQSLETIKSCGIAMTVTQGNANPADRFLYPLRSVTGTVESTPLIISSIVSKQLTFPVDHLLLDVRYGRGAFLKDLHYAKKISEHMQKLLHDEGIETQIVYTNAEEITGSSIGNSLEILEALSILSNENSHWHPLGIKRQKDLAIHMFSILLNQAFPNYCLSFWKEYGKTLLESGLVKQFFIKLLLSHKVADTDIKKLCQNPHDFFLRDATQSTVISKRRGRIKSIDQRSLGYFVNFSLGNARSAMKRDSNPNCGIKLEKLPGDFVEKGETLAKVFAKGPIASETLETFFTIE